jgi:hypothetical protein
MRLNAQVNREAIKKIATALGELNDQLIYVGGATVGLYVSDPAADDIRPTKDVDISLSLATLSALEDMRQELTRRGFMQTAEDQIICRFRYDEILVDVMNTKAIGWAPANPWFAPGFLAKEPFKIDGQNIFILPLSYFLASKFVAFDNRGNQEPRSSHDFEDIVYLLDNTIDLPNQIQNAPSDVKSFLRNEWSGILNDKTKQEAILGNLYFASRDKRFKKIMMTLEAMM